MGEPDRIQNEQRERIEHDLKDEIADLDVSGEDLEMVTGGLAGISDDGGGCGAVV
jgi:hypothetical protein